MAITITYNYITGGGDGTAQSDYYYNTPGAVAMAGGLGNDVYTVDNAGDIITENANEGTDKVLSSVSYSLSVGDNIENITLTGFGNLNAGGNELNNVLFGNSGSNILTGGAGDDTYHVRGSNWGNDTVIEAAGGGTDTIVSDSNFNLLAKGANVENLTLVGNARIAVGNNDNNVLTGTAGDNILNGKGGADTMIGGLGNDIYVVDDAGDTIVEVDTTLRGNTDTVYTSVNLDLNTNAAFVENVEFMVGSLTVTGNDSDNIYSVSDTSNTIIEAFGGGNDTLQSSVTNSLSFGDNIENITLTGSANIDAGGNELNNVLKGNNGSNLLAGGDGNDTYYVYGSGWGNDTVVEGAAGGTDTVISNSSFNLTAKGANVENLVLTGSAYYGIGNADNNEITGSAGRNVLNGKAGDDRLDGGFGNDILYGDSGADTFVFGGILNRGNRDVILDFTPGEDTIELSAALFGNIANPSSAMTDGYILYNQSTGMLYYDADAGGPGNSSVAFLQLTNGAALTDADFAVA